MWIVMYLYGLVASLQVPVISSLGLWGRPGEYDPEDFSGINMVGHGYPWQERRGSRRASRDNRQEGRSRGLVEAKQRGGFSSACSGPHELSS